MKSLGLGGKNDAMAEELLSPTQDAYITHLLIAKPSIYVRMACSWGGFRYILSKSMYRAFGLTVYVGENGSPCRDTGGLFAPYWL